MRDLRANCGIVRLTWFDGANGIRHTYGQLTRQCRVRRLNMSYLRVFCILCIIQCIFGIAAADEDEYVVRCLAEIGTPEVGRTPGHTHGLCDPALVNIGLDKVKGMPKAPKGEGLIAVLIDSGVNLDHPVFAEREVFVPDQGAPGRIIGHDFTARRPDQRNVDDEIGHGTFAASIIAARSIPDSPIFEGIAPFSHIIPLKILDKHKWADLSLLERALNWVRENSHKRFPINGTSHRIGVVNVSLGFGKNYGSSEDLGQLPGSIQQTIGKIRGHIAYLAEKQIAVVAASGNFHQLCDSEGMDLPAILPEVISVGAAYSRTQASVGERAYMFPGATATVRFRVRDNLAPFSQRLGWSLFANDYTTILAPGDDLIVAHRKRDPINSPNELTYKLRAGTSLAAPAVAGSILVIQDYFLNSTGFLPSTQKVKRILRETGTKHTDTDDGHDSVKHFDGQFRILQLYDALKMAKGEIDESAPVARMLAHLESSPGSNQ